MFTRTQINTQMHANKHPVMRRFFLIFSVVARWLYIGGVLAGGTRVKHALLRPSGG